MSSLFTKIINGDIPCHKVWEDDDHLAFLDINPMQPGHTLVVPKQEIDQVFEMDEIAHAALWAASRTVAALLKQKLGSTRICVIVQGYEIPHAHVHLIPTEVAADFPVPGGKPGDHTELAALAAKLRG